MAHDNQVIRIGDNILIGNYIKQKLGESIVFRSKEPFQLPKGDYTVSFLDQDHECYLYSCSVQRISNKIIISYNMWSHRNDGVLLKYKKRKDKITKFLL